MTDTTFTSTHGTGPAPRAFAVVGPETLHTPLTFIDVNCTWRRYDLVSSLILDLKSEAGPSFDAIVLSTAVPESLDDILYASAEIAASSTPVILLCRSEEEFRIGSAAWEPGNALFDRAKFFSGRDGNFPVALCPPMTTAANAMIALGGLMADPWCENEQKTLLGGRYDAPLPLILPAGGVGAGGASRSRRRARVSVVLSDKGGVGKSTVSLLTAATLAYRTHTLGAPRKVALVDLDRQSQLRLMMAYAGPGIESLTVQSPRDHIINAPVRLAGSSRCTIPNLDVLFGSASSGIHLASRTADLYEYALDVLVDQYDHIILDGSVGVTSDALTIWAQGYADDVLYVSKRGRLYLEQMRATYGSLTNPVDQGGLGRPAGAFQIVENMVPMSRNGTPMNDPDWDAAVRSFFPEANRFSLPFTYPDLEYATEEPMGLVNIVADAPHSVAPLLTGVNGVASFLAAASLSQSEGAKKRSLWRR